MHAPTDQIQRQIGEEGLSLDKPEKHNYIYSTSTSNTTESVSESVSHNNNPEQVSSRPVEKETKTPTNGI